MSRPCHVVACVVLVSLIAAGGCREPAAPPPARPGDRLALVPPPAATVLIGPGGLDHWEHVSGERPIRWEREGDTLIVRPGTGSIRTRETYQDFTLHVEFLVPKSDLAVTGQNRGNSGVYLQNRYEVQILDSFNTLPTNRGCGAVYGQRPPDVNAARAANTWQKYQIDFTAPRFDTVGGKIVDARITVRHNTRLIHDDVSLTSKTGAGAAEGPEPGPIVLQDHGSRVRFRNVWIQRR